MADIIKYVQAVPPKQATGLVAEVYDQARREMGRLPEAITMLSGDPALSAASWAAFREPLLATGSAARARKEVVAGTVSQLNQCPYCVDAHAIMLYGAGASDFATRLVSGEPMSAADPAMRLAAGWVAATMQRPAQPVAAPFPADQAPEMVGTLVHYHYLNRLLNVLVDGTFLPGSPRARKIARRVAGRVLSRYVRRRNEPNQSPGLRPGSPLPADLAWAAPAPNIAAAFAALAAVTGQAGERSVPPAVRSLLDDVLAQWDGQPPGLSAAWVSEPLAALSPADRPAGRLALLTALASYQVTDADVAAYRADHPADGDLLGAVAWAAFSAARLMGTWAAPSADAATGTDQVPADAEVSR